MVDWEGCHDAPEGYGAVGFSRFSPLMSGWVAKRAGLTRGERSFGSPAVHGQRSGFGAELTLGLRDHADSEGQIAVIGQAQIDWSHVSSYSQL